VKFHEFGRSGVGIQYRQPVVILQLLNPCESRRWIHRTSQGPLGVGQAVFFPTRTSGPVLARLFTSDGCGQAMDRAVSTHQFIELGLKYLKSELL
jgi:hypothetical protein